MAASARQPLGERAQCKEEAPGREKEKGKGDVAAGGGLTGGAPGRGSRQTMRKVVALGWGEELDEICGLGPDRWPLLLT